MTIITNTITVASTDAMDITIISTAIHTSLAITIASVTIIVIFVTIIVVRLSKALLSTLL